MDISPIGLAFVHTLKCDCSVPSAVNGEGKIIHISVTLSAALRFVGVTVGQDSGQAFPKKQDQTENALGENTLHHTSMHTKN